MAESTLIRKLVAGPGIALTVIASLLTSGSLPLSGLPEIIVSVIGATILYTSVALASAIHRSYPTRHDRPEDMGELFTEGPYRLCRHPFYFFTMLAQISIPLAFASLIGLLVAVALIPAWMLLIKVEERELIGYWGEKYLDYMRKTPALIPDPRKILSGNKSKPSP